MTSARALAALYDPAVAVQPFELSAQQVAWRTILHLLAEHGVRITLPAAFFADADPSWTTVQRLLDGAPGEELTLPAALFSTTDIAVAAGWLYAPSFTFRGAHVDVGCRFTRDVMTAAGRPRRAGETGC